MRLVNTTTLLLGLVVLAGVAGTCVVCRKANDGRATETRSVAAAIATMTALTERMCACTTRACADEVQGAMNAWSAVNANLASVTQATETEMQALQQIGTKYGQCMAVAMSSKEADRHVPSRPPPPEIVGTRGDLPKECQEYGVAIKELASCAQLPQETREALLQSYAQAESAWASIPDDRRAALAAACGQARDAARQSATSCQ